MVDKQFIVDIFNISDSLNENSAGITLKQDALKFNLEFAVHRESLLPASIGWREKPSVLPLYFVSNHLMIHTKGVSREG